MVANKASRLYFLNENKAASVKTTTSNKIKPLRLKKKKIEQSESQVVHH